MKSLRTKITLMTISAISIAMVAAAVLGVVVIKDIGNKATDRILLLLCETGEKNLDAYFKSVEQSVKMVTAYVEADLDGLDADRLGRHLTRARDIFKKLSHETNGIVTYYYRIDPSVSESEKGFWYVNLDGKGFEEHEVTDITQYDTENTSALVWFTVPKATGRPVWLPPYITDNLDVRVISYNEPIYYDGTFVGVVGIEIDYSTMADVVDSITLFDSGYAFINDKEGTIVYHPKMSIEELSENHPKVPEGLLSEDKFIHYNYDGVEKKAVWLPLSNGMRLNVTVPVSEIDSLWRDWVEEIVVLFVLLLIIFLILTMHLSDRITEPLRKLTEAAKQIDEGNYDVKLDYNGDDEIGILTGTFSQVTSHLKEYISDLNDLAYADALTSLHNKGAFDICIQKMETEMNEPDKGPEFAVCIFDCNDLKKVNDQKGHDKGDVYLQKSAAIICDVFNHSPVFRIGGDEFAAVLLNNDYENRESLLRKFDDRCRNTRNEGADLWSQIDIARGMAVYDPKQDRSVNDVVRRADKLMYENKWKHKHHIDDQKDELTNLRSRYALRQDFEMYLDIPLHIMVMDLDDFKTINETKGHAFGDSILVKTGNALTECFKGCHVYRYGNDEFLVIGENTPGKDFIADCTAVKKTLEESDISFSAGYVYGAPKEIPELRSMISQADEMLYEAKKAGNDQFRGKEFDRNYVTATKEGENRTERRR